jgi:hypothetical protein
VNVLHCQQLQVSHARTEAAKWTEAIWGLGLPFALSK